MDKVRRLAGADEYEVFSVEEITEGDFNRARCGSSKDLAIANMYFEEAVNDGLRRVFLVHKKLKILREHLKKAYIIKRWIPVDIRIEDDTVYEKPISAVDEMNRLRELQPENRYEVEEVEL